MFRDIFPISEAICYLIVNAKYYVSLPQEESETDMMSEEKQDILALQERISQLEKSLEYERLRVSAYERLIEIVKQEDGIDVLKKDGAKQ